MGGPSGYEGDVGAFIREKLAGIGELSTDKIGNIVCKIEGATLKLPTSY